MWEWRRYTIQYNSTCQWGSSRPWLVGYVTSLVTWIKTSTWDKMRFVEVMNFFWNSLYFFKMLSTTVTLQKFLPVLLASKLQNMLEFLYCAKLDWVENLNSVLCLWTGEELLLKRKFRHKRMKILISLYFEHNLQKTIKYLQKYLKLKLRKGAAVQKQSLRPENRTVKFNCLLRWMTVVDALNKPEKWCKALYYEIPTLTFMSKPISSTFYFSICLSTFHKNFLVWNVSIRSIFGYSP